MSRAQRFALYQADAFTATAFRGNPAAVLIEPAGEAAALSDEQRLKSAALRRRALREPAT